MYRRKPSPNVINSMNLNRVPAQSSPAFKTSAFQSAVDSHYLPLKVPIANEIMTQSKNVVSQFRDSAAEVRHRGQGNAMYHSQTFPHDRDY